MKKYVAELIDTFVLLFVSCEAAAVSGGVDAVYLAMLICRRMDGKGFVVYVIAQIAAAGFRYILSGDCLTQTKSEQKKY